MKHFIITILTSIISSTAISQYSVNTSGSSLGSDISVRVGENILYADLDIEIAENIIYEDFSIGFTTNRYLADVILTNSTYGADFTVNIKSTLYADLDIDISESQIYEDISIEIRSSGVVDYLIYNEGQFLSKEQLVVALLPIINAHLDYKFEDIPYWSNGGGIGEAENVLEPLNYCCPSLEHWVTDNDDGILTLDYSSKWLVYKDDQYISNLWLLTENISIKSTGVYGHYYLIKYNEYLDTSESIRAICVKN